MSQETCPGCGLMLHPCGGEPHAYIGASPSCWNLYGDLLAREFGDPAFMRMHQLTVDTYCAQHPGVPGRRAIQSINVHLVGLHLSLDRDLEGAFVRRVIAVVADRLASRLVWFDPPEASGRSTLRDVLTARSAEEHRELVTDWAKSVWDSWRPAHGAVAKLTDEALRLV